MAVSTYPGIPGQTQIDAILSGYSWIGTDITFGFADSATDFYGANMPGYSIPYSGYSEPNGFVALGTAGQDTVRAAAGQWAGLMNLGLTETTAHPNMNVGGSTYNVSTSQAYYPDATRDAAGDMWFGTTSFNADLYGSTPIKSGSYLAATAMHEMGHALGLKHPHQANLGTGGNTATLAATYDGLENSVMSYRSYLGGPTSYYTVKDGHYPQSLMVLDVAAIQKIYGADYTTEAGNTVYTFSTATGEMSVNGVGTGTPAANVVFRTLWDGGGVDTLNLSNYTADLDLDLNAGAGSTFDTGLAQRAQLDKSVTTPVFAANNLYMSLLANGDTRSLIENATGGSGNDTLTGNQAANVLKGGGGNDTIQGGLGNDTLYGDAGNDTLIGGKGRESLWGGAGADVFVFVPGDQSKGLADTVKDFEIGVDALDFSAFPGTDHLTDFALAHTASGLQITVAANQFVYLTGVHMADVAAAHDAFGW